MLKIFYKSVIAFLCLTASFFSPPALARADVLEKWVTECQVDQMDDKKGCVVSFNRRSSGFFTLFTGVEEETGMHALVVSNGGVCEEGKIRIDQNPAIEIKTQRGNCAITWFDKVGLTQQLLTGKTLRVRIVNYPSEVQDYEIDLAGFKEAYNAMLDAMKEKRDTGKK